MSKGNYIYPYGEKISKYVTREGTRAPATTTKLAVSTTVATAYNVRICNDGLVNLGVKWNAITNETQTLVPGEIYDSLGFVVTGIWIYNASLTTSCTYRARLNGVA